MDEYQRSINEEERLAHLVRLAARGFNRSLNLRLADHGVTFGQWTFLRILWNENGLSQRELSEHAGLTEPTTHTALLKLEKLGLVERRVRPENRRRQHAYLTPRGRKLRPQLEPLAIEVNAVAQRGLSAAERHALRQAMTVILKNLAEDEADARAEGRKVPQTNTTRSTVL